MVYDGIIIALIVGFLRKGNLQGIADLRLKAGYIFPFLLLLQIIIYIFQGRFEFLATISGTIFMVIYILGIYFLWQNRHHPGFLLIIAGVLMNFVVMALNGGRMPVSEAAAMVIDPHYIDVLKNGIYAKHVLLTENTVLPLLADIIPLSSPYPRSRVISIGDIFMSIGAFYFIQYLMVTLKHENTSKTNVTSKGGEVHG